MKPTAIPQLARARGMTITALAKRMGEARETVSRKAHGREMYSQSWAQRAADALGVKIEAVCPWLTTGRSSTSIGKGGGKVQESQIGQTRPRLRSLMQLGMKEENMSQHEPEWCQQQRWEQQQRQELLLPQQEDRRERRRATYRYGCQDGTCSECGSEVSDGMICAPCWRQL